jgi:RNA polymerase sigma-70 factor (ECF subfamily)
MSVALATAEWNAAQIPLALLRLSPKRPLVFLAGLLSSCAVPTRSQPTKAERVSERGERDSNTSSGTPDGGSSDFGELFRAYRGDVERVCRRMLGESGAQDAASEVFLRAQRALESYDPERPFRPWLLGIASHHCIDQLRRRAREARLFEAKDLGELELAHPGPSPLRRLAKREQSREILDAIDSLPRKYRLPIVLRYYEDLDYAAIAELLGVERAQVGTLLFRAKHKLRTVLSADDGEAES